MSDEAFERDHPGVVAARLYTLQRAAGAVIEAWENYYESPSVEQHRRLRDAVNRLRRELPGE
jgi:hypothetical protein